MNQLKKAVQDYLQMRRSLGYKLKKAPGVLSDFVCFLGEQGATHITIPLARNREPRLDHRVFSVAGSKQ
jgi:integrase/recombinase XerD